MPLYDYDCAACGRRFETIHGLFDDPPTVCPLCGSGPVRKAIGDYILFAVDANCGYDVGTAIAVGREIAKQNLLWFEEPIAAAIGGVPASNLCGMEL